MLLLYMGFTLTVTYHFLVNQLRLTKKGGKQNVNANSKHAV
jgi:hypothetical protein